MKTDPMELYLAEDEDLLKRVEAVGPLTTGTGATGQLNELLSMQIKATLRNRKSIHDMDATTTKFSVVLAAFAFVQIVLGIYAFLFTAETSAHPYIGIFYALCIGLLIYVVYRGVIRDSERRKGEAE